MMRLKSEKRYNGEETGKEQSLLFDLFNAFDQIESSQKSDFFSATLSKYATAWLAQRNTLIATPLYPLFLVKDIL